ncbi:conserved hypothetical protein [Sphingobacterium sp. PM2-P1-29]|nr:conserved hypothetical protein [Sphingobacterium sp. PM2-P1-29]
MYFILELVIPGETVIHEKDDMKKNHELNNLIQNLIDSFYEANLALNLFNQEQSQRRIGYEDMHYLRLKAIKEMDDQFDHLPFDEKNFQQEIYIKKYGWRNGMAPRDIQRKKIFMYAKCFLFSLDNFSKFLNVINNLEYNPPKEIGIAIKDLIKLFPKLRHLRNSTHHQEDIIRQLGKGKGGLKVFQLKPIDNAFVKSEGGAMIMNSLNNNNYGQTLGDGSYGEVEVSVEKLKEVKIILQNIVDCYVWEGRKRHLPG